MEPVSCVIVNECGVQTGKEVFYSDVEETVLIIDWDISLLQLGVCPFTRGVSVLMPVHVCAPWIPKENQAFTGVELFGGQDYI